MWTTAITGEVRRSSALFSYWYTYVHLQLRLRAGSTHTCTYSLVVSPYKKRRRSPAVQQGWNHVNAQTAACLITQLQVLCIGRRLGVDRLSQ